MLALCQFSRSLPVLQDVVRTAAWAMLANFGPPLVDPRWPWLSAHSEVQGPPCWTKFLGNSLPEKVDPRPSNLERDMEVKGEIKSINKGESLFDQ